MPGQEVGRVRLAAVEPLLEQLVEVADHLPVRRQVLGRHAADRLGQAVQVGVEDLTAQPLDERLELGRAPPARGSRSPPAPGSGRRGRRAAWRAPRAGARPGRPASCRSSRRASAPRPPPRLAGRCRDAPSRRRAPGCCRSSAQDVAEAIALQGLAPLGGDPLQQVAEAGQAGIRAVGRPPAALQQPAERLVEVAVGHHVVGAGRRGSRRHPAPRAAACRPSASSGRPNGVGAPPARSIAPWSGWIMRGPRVTGGIGAPPPSLARSLFSRRARCRPSSRNSTPEATGGRRVADRPGAPAAPASAAASRAIQRTYSRERTRSPVSSTRPSSNASTTSSRSSIVDAPVEDVARRLRDQALDDPLLGRLVAEPSRARSCRPSRRRPPRGR